MTRSLILFLAVVLTGCKLYDVHVKLGSQAENRRLASGKSDTIKGRLERADATNLYVRVDGELQAIPRADVVEVDQRLARRDVIGGGIAAGAGAALLIGGAIAFECGQNEFPVVCAFRSEHNLAASVAVLGGISLAALGLQALISGHAAQSDTDAILKRSATRLKIEPTVVRGESSYAPGLGATLRF